ncbi:MAG: hybrid sensor histidine kinase/response regulator [Candidatus Eremiobacteraeota bacterium]|nr:hybrid sensor histidine kinase/response regulator [Candidatus Eremiobacteraeota bacterium]
MKKVPYKILAIEADGEDYDHLCELLSSSRNDFHLSRAKSLSEGFAKLSRKKADLVLLELTLPDSKGIETIGFFFSQEQAVPAIVLTGIDDEKAAIEALRRGAQDYLVKGKTGGDELVRSIFYALERQRMRQEISSMKERFINSLSLDLKTSLTSIKGFASMLEDPFYGDISEEKAEFARLIVFSSDLMLALINNIESAARIEMGDMGYRFEDFLLKNLFIELKRIFEPQVFQSGTALVVDCPPHLYVSADLERIRQVFYNLVSNAFRYTPPEGTITLSAEEQGDQVLVMVTDTGYGIPPDEQERLFRKFTQGSKEKRGSGLGLYTVKYIIEAHGGRIEMESAPWQGTKFRFTLKKGSGAGGWGKGK